MDFPETLNVKSGDSAAIEVSVSGSAELKPKWFKDNRELSTSTKFKMSFSKKVVVLKIQSTDKADAGVYKLEIQNNIGKASCNVKLSVSGRYSSHLQSNYQLL